MAPSAAINRYSSGVNKRTVVALAFALLAHTAAAAVLPDKDIRAILADRIDVQRQSVGIVVGIIGPSGRRTIAYGNTNKVGGAADAVQRGEVALTDPVS